MLGPPVDTQNKNNITEIKEDNKYLLEVNYTRSVYEVHSTTVLGPQTSGSMAGPGEYRKMTKKQRKNHIKMPSTNKCVTEYVARHRKTSTENTDTDTPQMKQYTAQAP